MIVPLASAADLERACAEPLAVLYKHSPRCGVCIAAEREVRFFAEGHPAIPVYWLDVVTDRPLSQLTATRIEVPHESPQVILLVAGRAIWAVSHWEVRALDLEEQLARVPAA
jgi:bacillithiol system protein YtxJ